MIVTALLVGEVGEKRFDILNGSSSCKGLC